MARLNLRQWFSSRVRSPENDKFVTGDETFPEKTSVKEVLCHLLLTLIFVAVGAILVTLLVRSFNGEEQQKNPTQQFYPPPQPPPSPTTTPSRRRCRDLLKTLNTTEVENKLFLGRWILQEAYSTDSIDKYALTEAMSSWAEFYNDANTGTINLTMSHLLLRPENKTVWCVYHHFHNMTLRNNTLYLNLPNHDASAQLMFLKACNECLVLTAKAFVPKYPPLDYLLVYGLKGQLNEKLDEYFLQRTRDQAECLNFVTPPPFHYKGDEFCPENWNMSHENSVNRLSRGPGCPFSPGRR